MNANPIAFCEPTEGRYDRQELVSWWEQARLARAHILVVGVGALGNEVLKLLALIGLGRITFIDFDTISPSNLARMLLFRAEDVGQPKVSVAARRLHELNPAVRLHPIQGDLRFDLGLGVYRSADLIIGCLDSVNARWALNRRCMQAGVEWIDGGISDHHGTVARYSPAGGACYECTFTQATYERFSRRYSCPFGLLSDAGEPKMPTTALTTSAIAALQVQQALLMLHGLHAEALQPGERAMLYLKPFRLVTDRLPFNPDCLAHQTLPADIPALDCGPNTSVAEALAQAAARAPGVRRLALNSELLTAFHCPACRARQPVLRLKEQVFQHEAACPRCGELRQPALLNAITPGSRLARLSLAQAGFPAQDILSFESRRGPVYFQMSR